MSFTQFHKEIFEFINKAEIVSVFGNITKITDDYFYVKSQDIIDDCEIKCYYKNIFNFKIGDNIYLEGYINLASSLKIVINVDLIYSLTAEHIYNDMKNRYSKLEKKLSKKNTVKYINELKSERQLRFIKNIGLIVFGKDNENFIQLFNNSCVGNLYIYNVKIENIVLNFLLALTYFKNYKEIDTIVILMDTLSSIDILELSAENVVKYMLQTSLQYMILKYEMGKNIVTPLLAKICNEIYATDKDVIDFISSRQQKIRNIICENINLARKNIDMQLNKYFIILHNKKIENEYHTKNSIEILKKMLLSQLDKYKISLLERLIQLKN